MAMGIMAIATTVIWITVTYELGKSSEKQNNQKIFTFTALGTLSTLVLTVSLFQNSNIF